MLISDQREVILMWVTWNWVLSLFGWVVFAQVNPDCDYHIALQFGQQHILQNPGYDQGYYYEPNKVCRWSYSSPPGTVFDVTCDNIDIPWSNACQYDRLVVSLTGQQQLADGQNYCGRTNLKTTSVSNALTIGLISSPNSPGGRYRCIITPIGSGGPPPPTTTSTTARPNTCECGWRKQTRIVGGVETQVNEFPYMAALFDKEKHSLWCGATIISDRYAVTAAHCMYQKPASNYDLKVGDHNLDWKYETPAEATYIIDAYVIHQNYDPDTQINDIAIVRTGQVIQFSIEVGPICLPYRYTQVSFTNANLTALGWGSTYFTGPTSSALQKVNVTVIPQATCQKDYTNTNEIITNSQLCTYAVEKDACTFDSGGPLVWFDDFNTFRYQFIGIISYGKACATKAPGVNTRVTSFVSWILNTTPDANYCFK